MSFADFLDCNVPLMASRAKDKEICVNCNKDYKQPVQKAPQQTNSVQQPKAQQKVETQNPAEDANQKALDALEEEKQKILEKRRKEREYQVRAE